MDDKNATKMPSKKRAYKRDGTAGGDSHSSQRPNKRRKDHENSDDREQQKPTVDPSTGQRFVFNITESTMVDDEDLEWEDEGEALAYLKSVRYGPISPSTLIVSNPTNQQREQR